MAKKIKRDQHGKPSYWSGEKPAGVGGLVNAEISTDGGETWSPLEGGHSWSSPVVGVDATDKVNNLLTESTEHPRAKKSDSFSRRAYWAARHLLDQLSEDEHDVEEIVHLALELGFYTERARNELRPSEGGNHRKLPKDTSDIETKVLALMADGMTWTQASEEIGGEFIDANGKPTTGKAVRDALKKNEFTPPKTKPPKTKKNSRK